MREFGGFCLVVLGPGIAEKDHRQAGIHRTYAREIREQVWLKDGHEPMPHHRSKSGVLGIEGFLPPMHLILSNSWFLPLNTPCRKCAPSSTPP
jgi:hypothetical protein